MSELIEVQQAGDIVWTMNRQGQLRAWHVAVDGSLVEADPVAKRPLPLDEVHDA